MKLAILGILVTALIAVSPTAFAQELVRQDVRPGDAGQRRDEGFSGAEA